MNEDKKYHIALSFAGEDRQYVRQVASGLTKRGVQVFYDEYEQASLWGKNLYEHLNDVYEKRARFTVIFISSHYAKKLWTSHERQSAQARAFNESQEYILPARFDDTKVPGMLGTTGYIDLRSTDSQELVSLICEKLTASGVELPDPSSAAVKTIRAFARGEKELFRSLDHPKAKDIDLSIEYPRSWRASEAVRPNVVSKIFSEEGLGFEAAMILVKNLSIEETEVTEIDIAEAFSPEALTVSIPEGAVYIDGERTEVDGLPGAVSRYLIIKERVGLKLRMITLQYIFYFEHKFIFIQFSVAGPATQSEHLLLERYDSFQPLFIMMANSIVLHNRWK